MIMRFSSLAVAFAFTGLFSQAAVAQWGGSSLFTQDGVEVTVDKRVFAVFALMNANGYDRDTVTGPLPLERPQYSKARQSVRDRFRRPGPAVKGFARAVSKNPGSVEAYIDAALSMNGKLQTAKGAGKIAKAVAPHAKSWFNQEGGGSSFRGASSDSRANQKAIHAATDKLCHKLAGAVRFGNEEDQIIDETGAQGRVLVVINDLDEHGRLTRHQKGDTQYVVSGPLRKGGADGVARAASVAFSRTLLARELAKSAPKGAFNTQFKKLKKDARARFTDAKDFALEMSACALVQHVVGGDCTGSKVADLGLKGELGTLKARFAAADKAKELLKSTMPKLLAPLAPVAPPATPPAN